MEEHLANHNKVAGEIKYCGNNCFRDTIALTDNSVTHMNRKKGNDALGGGL